MFIGQMLVAQSKNIPDHLAIIDKERSLTYKELNEESNHVANALKRHHVKKRDKVALLMKSSVDYAVVWYACQKIGAVLVPLHLRLWARELAYMMEKAECSVLLYDQAFEEKAREMAGIYSRLKLVIRRDDENQITAHTLREEYSVPGVLDWNLFLGEKDGKEATVSLERKDPAMILFTSGTTADPKGVVRTQEMISMHASALAKEENERRIQAVMLTTAPLFHTGGLLCAYRMLACGGTFIIVNKIDKIEILNLIQRYQVTHIQMLPPASYERLYEGMEWKDYNLSSVWEVCISAGKFTPRYARHIFEMFPGCCLRPSWGSTETCSVTWMHVTQQELEEKPELIDNVGKCCPLHQIRIIDEKGNVLPEGKIGEAVVRSPLVCDGYLRDEEHRGKYFYEGDWFRTGDLMRVDPNTGCYYFIDRKKDVVKTGGENVYAPEIERVVLEYPVVDQCAVVGVPDERFGEAVGAAVVLMPGRVLNEEDLIDYCKTRLPSFQKPRYIAVLDRLPVNSVGKVQKVILRKNAKKLFRPIGRGI